MSFSPSTNRRRFPALPPLAPQTACIQDRLQNQLIRNEALRERMQILRSSNPEVQIYVHYSALLGSGKELVDALTKAVELQEAIDRVWQDVEELSCVDGF